MKFYIPPLISYVASWVATIAGIWFLFDKSEETINDETRNKISQWLKNLDLKGPSKNWPDHFLKTFDSIFGKRHFSFKCFFRSCVASYLSANIMFFCIFAFNPKLFHNVFSEIFLVVVLAVMSWTAIFSPFINFIPDYFSLLESRYTIKLMSLKPSIDRITIFLILDFIFTLSIVIITFYFIYLFIINYSDPGSINAFKKMGFNKFLIFTINLQLIDGEQYGNSGGIIFFLQPFFFSTFFTSIWVWLFAISGYTVKFLEYAGYSINHTLKYLDIDNKPLRSMGLVTIMLVSIIFAIIPFL
ncbi:MAG: hypothetical protein ACFFCM_19715 [Promethearchaeota archaeon]